MVVSINELKAMGLTEPTEPVMAGDAKKGSLIFKKKCASCHTCDKGGHTKGGPNLHGLFGRPAGTVADFSEDKGLSYDVEEGFIGKLKSVKKAVGERWYSEANQQSGITWSDKHLNAYLTDPRKYVPGTKMTICGIKKEKERADLIEYMRLVCGASAPGYGCPYDE